MAPESFAGVLGKPGTLRTNVPKAIIPSDNLFSPKIRLKHFPMVTEVTDFPKTVAALFQNEHTVQNPWTDGRVDISWIQPTDNGYK